MKKLFYLLLFAFGPSAIFAQVLFTYGSNKVGKEEFLRAYDKNKTTVTDKERALREYLDLYSKFKLKVKAAEDLRLDTLGQLKLDLQNFRNQIESEYINNDKGLNLLIDEAFKRGQKDIHLLHFYVPLNEKMAGTDSVAAFEAIQKVYDELQKENINEDSLIAKILNNNSLVKGGDIGYITAFSVPYEYENIAYSLHPGEINKPYRSKNAWHVFKELEERKSIGKWKVAQILFAVPPDASPEIKNETEKRADSVYNQLISAGDFATLAKKYSDDRTTYAAGGEMPEFGTGKYNLQFENNVFGLKNDGDISKPFSTSYGYHIVKRIHQMPTPSDKSDEHAMNLLKQQVLQDSRMASVKERFLQNVLVNIGYKKNTSVKEATILRYADSVINNKSVKNYSINKAVIFSFIKQKITGEDWLNYVNDYAAKPKGVVADKQLFDHFVSATAMEYYGKHLEEYNPDFKYQLQEFKEGNMLFEIMGRNVWNKAAADSIGLLDYYNQHKERYLWDKSADVLIFNCADKAAATEAASALKSGKYWKEISENSDGRIQSDSGRYEISQLQIPKETAISAGFISDPVINNNDNTASLIKVVKIYPANEQRSFEEAKGLVINDYQNLLEEKWIATLKKKYPVKVNEAVFQSLLK